MGGTPAFTEPGYHGCCLVMVTKSPVQLPTTPPDGLAETTRTQSRRRAVSYLVAADAPCNRASLHRGLETLFDYGASHGTRPRRMFTTTSSNAGTRRASGTRPIKPPP
jgi:hypothetical protein